MARSARDICVKAFDWELVADKISSMVKKVAVGDS